MTITPHSLNEQLEKAIAVYTGQALWNSLDLKAHDKDVTFNALLERELLIKRLLQEGADPNFIFSDQESTPLKSICLTQNSALISYLIEHGADVNFPYTVSNTVNASRLIESPLSFVVSRGEREICHLLLSKGAAVTGLIEHLTPNGVSYSPLYSILQNDWVESLPFFSDRGVNYTPKNGDESPLCIAARHKSLHCLAHLLENGAPANQRARDNSTALHACVKRNFYAGFKALLDAGADLHLEDSFERKPLDYAYDEHLAVFDAIVEQFQLAQSILHPSNATFKSTSPFKI